MPPTFDTLEAAGLATEAARDDAAAGLRGRAASGVRWGGVDQTIQSGVRFLAMVGLAHFVSPHDFGLMGMVWIVVNLLAVVTGLGFSQALIQRRELRDEHIRVAFTASTVAGLALCGVAIASAWPAARIFDQPMLVPLLIAMSTTFLFGGIEQTPNDLLVRSLRFREYYLSSTIASIIGAGVGFALALAGSDVWALVAMALTEAAVATVLGWMLAIRAKVWRPAIGWDRVAFRDLFGFGAYVTGAGLLDYAQTNGDNAVVGGVLGATSLGYYGLAYRTMVMPIAKVARVIGATAFPVFSKVQDDQRRLRTAFVHANVYVALLAFPATIGIAVTAPVFVPFVFGEEWSPAVRAFQLLALAGPVASIVQLDTALFRAVGRPQWPLWLAIIGMPIYFTALAIGVQYGINGVALAVLVTSLIGLPLQLIFRGRALGATIVEQLRPFVPLIAATVVMAAAAQGTRLGVEGNTGRAGTLAAMVAVGVVTYAAAIKLAAPKLLRDVVADVVRRR
jgi:O-antigen/teichoic acid export membrane protein